MDAKKYETADPKKVDKEKLKKSIAEKNKAKDKPVQK